MGGRRGGHRGVDATLPEVLGTLRREHGLGLRDGRGLLRIWSASTSKRSGSTPSIAATAARAATSAARRRVASHGEPRDVDRPLSATDVPWCSGPCTSGDGALPHVALQEVGSKASPYSRPVSVKSGGSGEATGDAASIWPGSLGAEALQTLSPCTMVP